jgi:NRAMP (natural resistance-associated macrophage protein)-like metal ion transporter
MDQKQNSKPDGTANHEIEPGMLVEAIEGDLGEADLSKPKVTEVKHDEAGNLDKIIVQKGVLFNKTLEIPADRIEGVEQNGSEPAKVKLQTNHAEVEALTPTGAEQLESKDRISRQTEGTAPEEGHQDPLDKVQTVLPTARGLEENEAAIDQEKETGGQANPGRNSSYPARATGKSEPGVDNPRPENFLKKIGPGFLAGMAGNDSSAVTSYMVTGSRTGYSQLWLVLLTTPILQAVQFGCAKIGRITQKGLSEILRENYTRWVAWPASLALIIANIALIAADLVAIGTGFELITGLGFIWFIVPVALVLWYITVYQSYDRFEKVFICMSFAFVAFLLTAFLARPNWGDVLSHTFIPRVDFSFIGISTSVAVLGATLTPYQFFWQVQGETEAQRAGSTDQKIRSASLDIGAGVISGNLIAYSVIITTAATAFVSHREINTAADAANLLEPLIGVFSKYLVGVGLIGAGMIAIPVLLASTSYGVAGSFGWPSSLSKKPWQNEGFYLILTVALLASLVVAMLGFQPLQLMFLANILAGLLAPILLVFILFVGNNSKIMGRHRFRLPTNLGIGLGVVILFAGAGLLLFGLLTGQS